MFATGITNSDAAGLASSSGGARALPLLTANLQLARSGEESRLWVNLYFAYVAVVTFAYGLIVTRISRNWIISDWLINYRGGLVRRGFPGQIAYLLSHLLHISTVGCVAFFYLSLYGIFFAASRRLALHSSRSLWLLALIFSPATFAFQILHAQGGFRKEIIYLVALTSLAVWLREMRPTSVTVSICLTIAVVVCVLSHESLLFFSPYFVAVLLLSGRPLNVVARVCIAPAITGMVAALWCSMHHGDAAIASQICSSLGYKLLNPTGHDICGSGAIPYLARTSSMARAETLMAMRQNHYLAIFPGFALAALIPAIIESIALVRAGGGRDVLTLWSCVSVSFCGSIILFLYAQDWGRWIYIHVTSITVLLLVMDGRIVGRGSEAGLVTVKAQLIRHRAPIAAFLFAYAVTWALPVNLYGISPRMGYLSRFPELVHHVYPGTAPAAEYK
jgi:hypothetical protein